MTLPRYEPMLAVARPQPSFQPGWVFEPKFDGIRGILSWDGFAVDLRTRTGREVSDRYPELAAVRFDRPAVIDGEIVVLEGPGKSSFQRLQQRSGSVGSREHPVSLVAFDLLHIGSEAVLERSLEERRDLLQQLGIAGPVAVNHQTDDGEAMWITVVDNDLEGMVAKRRVSPYRPGVRSPDWQKTAHLHSMRAVVGGFTAGEGGRASTFGSLVLGLWEGDRLRWVGNVGTGFSDEAVRVIRSTLDELTRSDSSFHGDPDLPAAEWVEPALVAVVSYRNWTDADRLRHPVFKGFSDDPVGDVTWGAEGPG